jgi:hypothetical protein
VRFAAAWMPVRFAAAWMPAAAAVDAATALALSLAAATAAHTAQSLLTSPAGRYMLKHGIQMYLVLMAPRG